MATNAQDALDLTPDQQNCREEWQHLCLALERAQGDNLVQNCHDKFQYAKTYVIYGRELEQTIAEVKQSAVQGNYQFFTERGISIDHMSPELAVLMMKDWKAAVASKRAFVAEKFQGRFNEDIDQFVGTPHNASRLIMSISFDSSDAILQLAEVTQTRLSAIEIAQLRADISQIKAQLEQLSLEVMGQLKQLAKCLGTNGREDH